MNIRKRPLAKAKGLFQGIDSYIINYELSMSILYTKKIKYQEI